MKKLNARFTLFALFAVVSVYAPLSIVWKYENTLRHGTLYKFRTRPVDPYDAFRGRYVTLGFADDLVEHPHPSGKTDEAENQKSHELNYPHQVRLAVDAEGFAKPIELSLKPLAGDDVITVERSHNRYAWSAKDKESIWVGMAVEYPFNRYYLPEDIAPMAEKLYQETNRRENEARAQDPQGWQEEQKARKAREKAREMPTYAVVRVLNGVGVLEELYINGKPVREAVREAVAKAELEKK